MAWSEESSLSILPGRRLHTFSPHHGHRFPHTSRVPCLFVRPSLGLSPFTKVAVTRPRHAAPPNTN